MTADEFEMDWHSSIYSKRGGEWDIKARDGDIKVEFTVYDEAVQEAVKDNFEYIADTIRNEILCRIDSAWDEGKITDEERDTIARILEEVVG